MDRGKSLILGVVVGAVTFAFYHRLKQVAQGDSPERLLQDLTRKVEELDRRIEQARRS